MGGGTGKIEKRQPGDGHDARHFTGICGNRKIQAMQKLHTLPVDGKVIETLKKE